MNKEETIHYIKQNPLVPVYYNADIDTSLHILQATYDAGLRVFEFTSRGSNASSVFARLKQHQEKHCPDLLLGIGTISTAAMATQFIELGAHFVVQPGLVAEVAKVCQKKGIAWVPGVLTPTEIYMAQDLGAHMVKIFPAKIMGSAYIKALRGPMPEHNIMVTGGIEPTQSCLKEWFAAGANVLGLGSQLFKDVNNLDTFKATVKSLISSLKP